MVQDTLSFPFANSAALAQVVVEHTHLSKLALTWGSLSTSVGEAGPTCTSPLWGPKEQQVLLEVGERLAVWGPRSTGLECGAGAWGPVKLVHA